MLFFSFNTNTLILKREIVCFSWKLFNSYFGWILHQSFSKFVWRQSHQCRKFMKTTMMMKISKCHCWNMIFVLVDVFYHSIMKQYCRVRPFLSSTNLTVRLTPPLVPPILSVVGKEGAEVAILVENAFASNAHQQESGGQLGGNFAFASNVLTPCWRHSCH